MSSIISSEPSFPKRQTDPVQSNDPRLVLSSDINHSAVKLCASASSVGPDLFNTAEGQFCQMSSKTVYSVCSAAVTDNCFNSDTQKLIVGGVSLRDDQYSKVIDWTDGS